VPPQESQDLRHGLDEARSGEGGGNLEEAVRLLRENAELLRGLRELQPLEHVPDGALDSVNGVLESTGVTL
jgi:hypothetical protein